MVLSNLAEITSYIYSEPINKWDEWDILSAVQREIDMRYAVVPDRVRKNFIDLAGFKSQTIHEAIKYFQQEMFELAPYFLNLDYPYQSHKFNTFPQYYSRKELSLSSANSIERLFNEGTVPNEKIDCFVDDFNAISVYNTFLTNVCYWLGKFRYRNACPYTFTLSTYTRDWEYTEENGQLSVDDTSPSPDNWDIWDMANQNTGDLRPKEWKTSTDVSADNNGQQTNGVQIEVFQWFRRRHLNNPLLDEEYNGYPASDMVQNAEGMPYGKEPPWKTIDPSELTAEWSQYEWELDDPNVIPRHIPYDLSEWVCKTRLSTVTGVSWETLEKPFDTSLSTQWGANLSAGWDKVMTNYEKSHWGVTYLSAFPVTGLTGKVVGIPSLSATPEASQNFFPDNGHRMYYTLEINHNSEIYEEWNPSYWASNAKIDTKQRETKHIKVHKEKMPFEVTVENPTAYEADGYVVFYPAFSNQEHIFEQTINDTKKFRLGGGMPPSVRELLVEAATSWTGDDGLSSYDTLPNPRYLPYRNGINIPLSYQNEILHHYEFSWPGLSGSSKTTDNGTEKNWDIPHNEFYLLNEWDLSSGGPAGYDYNYYGSQSCYPDSFGLYQEGESEGESSGGGGGDETSASVAMQFLPTKTFEPYSYDTIWEHLSSDTPPIDFNMEEIANKELQGPYYNSGNYGTTNDVIYSHSSTMRIYTFFDFSKAFNLDKELD